MAISEATIQNGCLAVIPGSHDRVRPFDLVRNAGQDRRRWRVSATSIPTARCTSSFAPGEVALFSANVIHGSAANRSRHRRFAVLHDFTATGARQSIGKGAGQLVRGRDTFGHFGHEPAPTRSFEENVRTRRAWLTAYPENILMGPLAPGAVPEFPDRREVPA